MRNWGFCPVAMDFAWSPSGLRGGRSSVGLWWRALTHPSLFLFSPPENSALLETPENESSKLHCGKIKASLHWGKLVLVQGQETWGPKHSFEWTSRLLHVSSTFGLNWVECFLGLEWDAWQGFARRRDYATSSTTSLLSCFELSYHVRIAWVGNYVLYQKDCSILRLIYLQ